MPMAPRPQSAPGFPSPRLYPTSQVPPIRGPTTWTAGNAHGGADPLADSRLANLESQVERLQELSFAAQRMADCPAVPSLSAYVEAVLHELRSTGDTAALPSLTSYLESAMMPMTKPGGKDEDDKPLEASVRSIQATSVRSESPSQCSEGVSKRASFSVPSECPSEWHMVSTTARSTSPSEHQHHQSSSSRGSGPFVRPGPIKAVPAVAPTTRFADIKGGSRHRSAGLEQKRVAKTALTTPLSTTSVQPLRNVCASAPRIDQRGSPRGSPGPSRQSNSDAETPFDQSIEIGAHRNRRRKVSTDSGPLTERRALPPPPIQVQPPPSPVQSTRSTLQHMDLGASISSLGTESWATSSLGRGTRRHTSRSVTIPAMVGTKSPDMVQRSPAEGASACMTAAGRSSFADSATQSWATTGPPSARSSSVPPAPRAPSPVRQVPVPRVARSSSPPGRSVVVPGSFVAVPASSAAPVTFTSPRSLVPSLPAPSGAPPDLPTLLRQPPHSVRMTGLSGSGTPPVNFRASTRHYSPPMVRQASPPLSVPVQRPVSETRVLPNSPSLSFSSYSGAHTALMAKPVMTRSVGSLQPPAHHPSTAGASVISVASSEGTVATAELYIGSAQPAHQYRADSIDLMDTALSWALGSLDSASASALWLRRLSPGKYEIDGRLISLRWKSNTSTELMVCEHEVSDPGARETPLLAYLSQAANVAASRKAVLANAKVSRQMTFKSVGDSIPSRNVEGKTGGDARTERIRSMRRACTQASFRSSLRD